jgi:DNA polymerase III delta subunit
VVYLFVGEDNISKDIKLNKLKQDTLPKEVEHFNLDTLYAKELTLRDLQEKLLCLPVKAKKRLIVIKYAEALREDAKEFLINYVKKPYPKIILVLDISRTQPKDEFINRILKYTHVFRFKEPIRIDTFTLSRQIDLRKPDYALKILSQLLKNGEKPERILGGLRYCWERDAHYSLEMRRRLKLLLECDIDIKTGRLKPAFALEKLVVSLCLKNILQDL